MQLQPQGRVAPAAGEELNRRQSVNETKAIGALWAQTAQSGRRYLSGTVELEGQKHRIVVFKNTFKDADSRQPDYRILLSEKPREQHPSQDTEEIEEI